MTWYGDLAAKLVAIFRPAGGFNWAVAGPEHDEHPPVTLTDKLRAEAGAATPVLAKFPPAETPWSDGWWARARRTPAHPGRIGPAITPRKVVVHTTDTYPGAFGAIVSSWTGSPGAGNCAHFMIGRTAADGVVQFAPITRNANHAGGRVHGWWKLNPGGLVHPNTCSVGIELDCAGMLTGKTGLLTGPWIHPDTGREIPPDAVYSETFHRAWHRPTQYQFDVLRALLSDLRPCLTPFSGGPGEVVPDGDYADNGVPWAKPKRTDVVGHVQLDPVNKTDPGPQVLGWLRDGGDV